MLPSSDFPFPRPPATLPHPMGNSTEIAAYRLEELTPGLKHDFTVDLTAALINQFAACSGDISPIHMDAKESSARGFSKRVAHGMLLGSLLSRLVGCHLPGRHALLMNSTLHFHKPCLEGDIVRVEGTIDSVSPATRSAVLSFRFTVGNELRAKGTALVGVHA